MNQSILNFDLINRNADRPCSMNTTFIMDESKVKYGR